MRRRLPDVMDRNVFEPLREFVGMVGTPIVDVQEFIDGRGIPETLRVQDVNRHYGFVLEEYFKMLLVEFRSKTGIPLRETTILPRRIGEYTLERNKWGNVKVSKKGNDFCEIDSLCSYQYNSTDVPVIFEVSGSHKPKRMSPKRQFVERLYNQIPFTCKIRFFPDEIKREAYWSQYTRRIYIPYRQDLRDLAGELKAVTEGERLAPHSQN